MARDTFNFGIGVVAGMVLGLLMRDSDKRRIQEIVSNKVNHMRDKCHKGKDIAKEGYEDLSRKGKETAKEGLDKI